MRGNNWQKKESEEFVIRVLKYYLSVESPTITARKFNISKQKVDQWALKAGVRITQPYDWERIRNILILKNLTKNHKKEVEG